MRKNLLLISFLVIASTIAGCTKSCDENEAMNKMLALNSLQGRLVAKGGEGLTNFGLALGSETGIISELIAQKKYTEACQKADELEKKYDLNLAKEQEGMITYEQLVKDGGKGSGTCSVADAAQKQMELHGLLQAEVDAGRKTTEIFNRFGEDTKGVAEMYSTNPSKACELFEKLKVKYGLKK